MKTETSQVNFNGVTREETVQTINTLSRQGFIRHKTLEKRNPGFVVLVKYEPVKPAGNIAHKIFIRWTPEKGMTRKDVKELIGVSKDHRSNYDSSYSTYFDNNWSGD